MYECMSVLYVSLNLHSAWKGSLGPGAADARLKRRGRRKAWGGEGGGNRGKGNNVPNINSDEMLQLLKSFFGMMKIYKGSGLVHFLLLL